MELNEKFAIFDAALLEMTSDIFREKRDWIINCRRLPSDSAAYADKVHMVADEYFARLITMVSEAARGKGYQFCLYGDSRTAWVKRRIFAVVKTAITLGYSEHNDPAERGLQLRAAFYDDEDFIGFAFTMGLIDMGGSFKNFILEISKTGILDFKPLDMMAIPNISSETAKPVLPSLFVIRSSNIVEIV